MPDPQQEAYRRATIGQAAAAATLVQQHLQRVDEARLVTSLAEWVERVAPLLRVAGTRTAEFARLDYLAAREYQGVSSPLRWTPVVPDEQVIRRSLFSVTSEPLQNVERYGSFGAALKRAQIAAAGSSIRHVMNGARNSTIENARNDPDTIGAVYLTRGDDRVCYWCAMLESRGPVYKDDSLDDSNASFVGVGTAKVHDACRCILRPVYREDTDLLDRARELEAQWKAVTRDPANPGRILLSGKSALKAWRSYWEQRPLAG